MGLVGQGFNRIYGPSRTRVKPYIYVPSRTRVKPYICGPSRTRVKPYIYGPSSATVKTNYSSVKYQNKIMKFRI